MRSKAAVVTRFLQIYTGARIKPPLSEYIPNNNL